MGKLVVTEFVSVDGVFEDPGGSDAANGTYVQLYSDEREVCRCLRPRRTQRNQGDRDRHGRDGNGTPWSHRVRAHIEFEVPGPARRRELPTRYRADSRILVSFGASPAAPAAMFPAHLLKQ